MTRDCKGKLAYLCKLLTKKRSRCAKRDQKLLYLSSEKLLLMLYYPIMHSGKEVVTSGAQLHSSARDFCSTVECLLLGII